MRRRPHAFTILEVMISIAILAMLTAALMTFGFSLGERRDRLMREGERGAMLSRVMDRVERVSASARRPASTGSSWLEITGRGVWPAAGESGVPAGPVGFTGRLEFSRDAGELVWRETSEQGDEVELVIGDVEAVLVDRFDDLVTTSGSRPPVRVSIWLAAVGRVRPAEPTEDELAGEMATLDALPLGEEDELPLRAADVVLVVADPMGVSS